MNARNLPNSAPALPSARRSGDWIIGWKVANLLLEETGGIAFSSLYQYGIITYYGYDAVAECSVFPGHKAPEATHRCGFNAMDERSDAKELRRNAIRRPSSNYVPENLVLLRVGLYGRVQEGTYPDGRTWGYKAERQRIANVFIPQACGVKNCSADSVSLGTLVTDVYALPGTAYLRPLCAEHISASPQPISLSQASTRFNNVPFVWET